MEDADEASVTVPVLGWDIFFQELEQFVNSLDRHEGVVNEAYTEYVTERLEVCIVGVRRLKNMFTPTHWRSSFSSEELAVVETYYSLLSDLVACLRELARKWSDQWDRHSLEYEYSTGTEASGRPGRPKFCVAQSQLEYLEGMAFNWSQISQMLGVSRTTIYLFFNIIMWIDPQEIANHHIGLPLLLDRVPLSDDLHSLFQGVRPHQHSSHTALTTS